MLPFMMERLGITRGQSLLSILLCLTPLQYFPVRVRHGLAKGARWTFLPYSHNWRQGGEQEIIAAVAMLDEIKDASCWDMGAHHGIHTLGLAMQVGQKGQVAAFEPDPVSFRRLARHIRMNRLPNVRLFNFATSDRKFEPDGTFRPGMERTARGRAAQSDSVKREHHNANQQCPHYEVGPVFSESTRGPE